MKNLSKFLSLILRHDPSSIGITLDINGWADVEELINGFKLKGNVVSVSDLEQIVLEDTKGRYVFNTDKTKIRATQGHSIKVDLELQEMVPPSVLFHGTNSRFLDSIMREGLKPMQRHHVHLSEDLKTARDVADRRLKKDTHTVIFAIRTEELISKNIKFYKSENNVWLVDSVSPLFLREIIKIKVDE